MRTGHLRRPGHSMFRAGDGTRTRNLLITNQLLYQLSYASRQNHTPPGAPLAKVPGNHRACNGLGFES